MSLQPFDGPKLKIERAKAHIRDLKRHSDVFLERKPYSLLVEPDDETRQRRVIFRIQEEVPAEIPLIIGDAIHNLRSSLDIMICDVLALVGDPSRRGRFPFADSADGLETVMKKKIKRAPDDIKQMIRSLKPYKGSGGPLRGLHDLDIADKHQLIIVAGTAFRILRRYKGDKLIIDSPIVFKELKDGDVFLELRPGISFKYDEDIKPGFNISFGQAQPFESQPIVPTIDQLAQFVESVIKSFEAHCLRRNGIWPSLAFA